MDSHLTPSPACAARQDAQRLQGKAPCCPGYCEDAIKKEPTTERWFITMGHAGFNSPTNHHGGYKDWRMARRSHRKYANLALYGGK